jgi:murein DD-endopeptidase MepM/ murein hydrolase activator NlpD
MTTAVVGAGVVAMVTGTAMPDRPSDPSSLALVDASALQADADRAKVADRANRADASRGTTGVGATAAVGAPDVYFLPLHNYTLTSTFGQRWGRPHTGIDLAAPEGTQYHAVARGKVILARYYGGYGNCIIIDHGGGISSVYGHSVRLKVKEGDIVEAGQYIGDVGNTGHSFGAHLHLEIRINNVPVEPIAWLREHGADVPGKRDPLTQ